MTHQTTLIHGNDLCEAFGTYDSDDVASCLGADNYDSIDWNSFWLVSWPQHVTTPRFNSDANYSGPFASKQEAQECDPEAVEFIGRWTR